MVALYIQGKLADIKGDIGISINVSQKAVNDTGSVKGAFSYTVKLPVTPNNERIFAAIWDMDVDANDIPTSQVNPNLYATALLIEDGRMRLVCRVKLMSFGADSYDIQLIAQNNGWANVLKDTKLNEVDRSAISGEWLYERWQSKYGICDWKDKALNAGNIDPLYFTAENGEWQAHCYPVLDLGGSSLTNTNNRLNIAVNKQRPAVFVKHLLAAHFQQLGYRLDYEYLEGLIMPLNAEKWKAVFDDSVNFYAELVQTYADLKFSNASVLYATLFNGITAFGINDYTTLVNAAVTPATLTVGNDTNGCTSFANANIDIQQYVQNTIEQPMAIEVEFSFRLVASRSGETFYRGPLCTDPVVSGDGFFVGGVSVYIQYEDLSQQGFFFSGLTKVFHAPQPINKEYCSDQTVSGKFIIQPSQAGTYKIYYGFQGEPIFLNAQIFTEQADTLKVGSYIRFRGIAGDVFEGSDFDLRAALPDITVGKIISSITKMLNLYWFTDEDERLVIPKPFDEHFIAPDADISTHVNRAKPLRLSKYNEKLERFRNFKYSDDSSDYYLQGYLDEKEKTFGTYQWENNNLTKVDSKDETVDFAPTYSVESANANFGGYFVPTMWTDATGSTYNAKPTRRILYYKNVSTTNFAPTNLTAPDLVPTLRVAYAVQDAACYETFSYHDSAILPFAWFMVNGVLVSAPTMIEAFEAHSLRFDDGTFDADGYGDGLHTRYYDTEDTYIRSGKFVEFELNLKGIDPIELFDLRRLWVLDKHVVQIVEITGYKPSGNNLVGIKAIIRI